MSCTFWNMRRRKAAKLREQQKAEQAKKETPKKPTVKKAVTKNDG